MKTYTEKEAVALLDEAAALNGQSAFARKHGLRQSTISEVLAGNRRLPDSVARALGLEKCWRDKP